MNSIKHKDIGLTIAIVDDELPARQSLTTMIANLRPDCQIIGEADSVATGIQLIRQLGPDLVLLDISLEDGTGFDLLEMFPQMGFKVIFTTAYDDFAVKAFRYNALDYLLKPILPRELVGSIDRAKQESKHDHEIKLKHLLEETKNQTNKLVLHSQEGLVFLKLDQTVRLEADGNYTTFFNLQNERNTISQPLREFEEMLPSDSFFRIHQSHIINFNFVKKLVKRDGGFVAMEDGSQLPIARRRKEQFVEWLMQRGKE